ncbi:MAG TPA: ATP-binding protein [Streptosporangiaceae bacterium]|nr:ATP-binding protein [Streptosporangiaceae bacterium]
MQNLTALGGGAGGARFRWLRTAFEKAALAGETWHLRSDEPGLGGQWTNFPAVAVRTPGSGAAGARVARDFAVATAVRWGAAGRADDIAVVVSELVSNAIRHAPPRRSCGRRTTAVRLGLLRPDGHVLCAVVDPSHEPPVPGEPGQFAESGRGLHVVSALADHWGYAIVKDTGKVVWALFATEGTAGLFAGPMLVSAVAPDEEPAFWARARSR